MEIEPSDKPTKYMSFLSEDDDDDDNKLVPSAFTQEYISPLELNKPPLNKDNDDNHKSQWSDKSSSLSSTIDIHTTDVFQRTSSSTEDSSSNKQIETISENIQASLLNKKDQSSISVNSLDSNRIQIVLRLLHVLTQVPETFKPLRLVRRRIQQKEIPKEQVTVSTDKTDAIVTEIPEHSTLEQPKFIEEMDTKINDISETQVSLEREEQSNSIEEIHTAINETPKNQVSTSIEEQLMPNEETHETISSELHEVLQTSDEENCFHGKSTLYKSFKDRFLFYFVEQLAMINESSMISTSQESVVILFYLNNFFFLIILLIVY
jgi:hypothetical protein